MTARAGRLPVVLQAERSECALACLAMVLGYHGHQVDLHTLRHRCPVSQHGITLKNLLKLAGRLDLVARPLRLDLADLDKLNRPAILHWKLDHFVILKAVTPRHLVIHDPASGRREIGWREAGKCFTGIALEVLPAPGFQARDDRQRLSLRQLWAGITGLGRGWVQLLVLSLLLQVFALALPFYTQLLVDDVLVNGDLDLLKLLAGGFLVLTVFRQLTEWLRARLVLYLGNRVSFHFATRLCRHLLHLPMKYFSRRHMGDIVSRFGSLNAIRDFLCSGMVEVFIDGLMVSGALGLMLLYDGWLTVIALVAVLLYGLVRLASYRPLRTSNEEWINDRALENTQFMENVRAIQGIKMFGRETSRLGNWQNRYVSALNAGIRTQKLGIDVQFAHGLLVGLENILLLLVGAYAVLDGALSVGMLLAFISYKDHFYRSVFSLLDKVFEFRLLDVHLQRLADIAYTEPESQARQWQGGGSDIPATCSLVVEDVAYTYDSDQTPLFRQVSLAVRDREVVAIVGPTGCGKSTLLKLIAGLETPQRGKLQLDGKPVVPGTLADYRAQVAGVLQNDSLLSGSILENITFFDATPDLEKARDAARLAAIAEEIALMPMQFQTMVGSMGAALSGGQIQRLLLARAIYHEPRLLVLDEATSHLDIHTEARVNQSLRGLAVPCIMVAHRPETVLKADRILCLCPDGLRALEHRQFRELMSNELKNDVITI